MGVGGSAPVVSAHRPQDDRALVCSACGAAKEGYAAADAAAALVTHTPHSAGPHVRQYVPHALRCSFSLTPNTQTQSQTPNLKPQSPIPNPQTPNPKPQTPNPKPVQNRSHPSDKPAASALGRPPFRQSLNWKRLCLAGLEYETRPLSTNVT